MLFTLFVDYNFNFVMYKNTKRKITIFMSTKYIIIQSKVNFLINFQSYKDVASIFKNATIFTISRNLSNPIAQLLHYQIRNSFLEQKYEINERIISLLFFLDFNKTFMVG